jgi:hypothetical protein
MQKAVALMAVQAVALMVAVAAQLMAELEGPIMLMAVPLALAAGVATLTAAPPAVAAMAAV